MNSAHAFGFAWIVWIRQRRALVVAVVAIAIAALVYPWLFHVNRSHQMVIASSIPLIGVFGLLLNALLFVQETGNLSSSYPPRMFALPVRTSALALWPMAISASVSALLWIAATTLIYRRSGFEVPVFLPALGIAALMAVLHALSWCPVAPLLLRMLLSIVVIAILTAVPVGLMSLGMLNRMGVALVLAGYTAAAGVLAVFGLGRARQGQEWPLVGGLALRVSARETKPKRRRPFRSASRAQVWYEWRCHGLTYPTFVGALILLPVLAALVLGGGLSDRAVIGTAVTLLVLPPLTAGVHGAQLARMVPLWEKAGQPFGFVTLRPMSTADLVAAKLQMVAASVVLAWLVVVVGAAMTVLPSGKWAILLEAWKRLFAGVPIWRQGLIAFLAVVSAVVLTWRQLTDGIPAGLTGRRTVVEGFTVLLALLMGMGGIVVAMAAGQPALADGLRRAGPWILGAAVAVKLAIAALSLWWAWARGLVRGLELKLILGGWMLVVVVMTVAWCAGGAMDWVHAGWGGVTGLVALVIPLGRFGLSTLALDWARHR